ncbi:hypothetical protein AGMMS49938_03410 [Fibrobacterales bacterium]|nr:hypothetical protein AGMMS49938_03410 [Fibrobacterales bacterium]
MKNVIDTARTEDLVVGRAEGELAGEERGETRTKQTIARSLKSQGVAVSVIIAATGLSAEEIEKV